MRVRIHADLDPHGSEQLTFYIQIQIQVTQSSIMKYEKAKKVTQITYTLR